MVWQVRLLTIVSYACFAAALYVVILLFVKVLLIAVVQIVIVNFFHFFIQVCSLGMTIVSAVLALLRMVWQWRLGRGTVSSKSGTSPLGAPSCDHISISS